VEPNPHAVKRKNGRAVPKMGQCVEKVDTPVRGCRFLC
jgi:hypothetical protein